MLDLCLSFARENWREEEFSLRENITVLSTVQLTDRKRYNIYIRKLYKNIFKKDTIEEIEIETRCSLVWTSYYYFIFFHHKSNIFHVLFFTLK